MCFSSTWCAPALQSQSRLSTSGLWITRLNQWIQRLILWKPQDALSGQDDAWHTSAWVAPSQRLARLGI